jgi:hypothetical protein
MRRSFSRPSSRIAPGGPADEARIFRSSRSRVGVTAPRRGPRKDTRYAIEPSRPHTAQDSPSGSGFPPHPGQFSSVSSTPSNSPTRHTSSRSSSTSIHAPADAGNTTWSPGRTGIAIPTFSHQSRPGPTASTMPCWGGGSSEPGGTIRPDRRIRSGSSSLITTRSNRGRSWLRMTLPLIIGRRGAMIFGGAAAGRHQCRSSCFSPQAVAMPAMPARRPARLRPSCADRRHRADPAV